MFFGSAEESLGFLDFPGFNCLGGNPQPLYLTAGQFYSNSLKVGTKDSFVHFDQLQADTSGLLGLALVYDSAALAGALTGDGANSGHGYSSWVKRSEIMGRQESNASFFTLARGHQARGA